MSRHTASDTVAHVGEVCSDARVNSVRAWSLLLVLAGLALPSEAVAFDDDYKRLGGVWDVDDSPITYSLDPGGSDDIDDDGDLQAVRDSFRAWACTPGTKLRFEELAAPGPRVIDTSDGKNTVFWDETGTDCLMGPGTLGITVGDVDSTPRTAADICFNGLHHTWGVATQTDVQSIAMHEIGHFIGLAHPCDSDADADTCLPATDSIMFPAWTGSPDRRLLVSDVAGVVGLYPADADDPSGCEGPYRAGEVCTCNDECVEGLACAPDIEGVLRCAQTCSGSNRSCGAGSACVLNAPVGSEEAVGLCVRVEPPNLPAGAICSNGTDCASGTCLAQFTIGSSLCQVPCRSADACGTGTCFEGICLGGFDSEECPASAGAGCACVEAGSTGTLPGGLGVVATVWCLMRRRRGGRRS
jgi:hypothetical protein